MPDRRGSALILVLIAVALLGGRLLTDSSRIDPATAGVPDAVLLNLGESVDHQRIELASGLLAKAEVRRARKRAARQRQRNRFRDLPGSVSRATLESIANCESGGDPRIVSANGLYHGKYQFSLGAWSSVGGKGSPAAASEIEQDYRAALLYERSGPGQWPVCGS